MGTPYTANVKFSTNGGKYFVIRAINEILASTIMKCAASQTQSNK